MIGVLKSLNKKNKKIKKDLSPIVHLQKIKIVRPKMLKIMDLIGRKIV